MIKYLANSLLIMTLLTSFHANAKDKLHKVYVKKIDKETIISKINYIGRISPIDEAKIYSPIDGIVLSLNAHAGIPVKAGQVLGVIKQNVIGLEVLPVKITSPISGNLYRALIEKNGLIRKNSHLFTVYRPGRFKLLLNISPDDAEKIRYGDKAKVTLQNKVLTGKVRSISPDIDYTLGTRLLELELETNDTLRPGMLATASFSFNKREGYLVDINHLKKKGAKRYLRVLDGENKVKELPVTIGERFKSLVEIENKELKESNTIVTKSNGSLRAGQKVEVVEKKKL